MRAALTQADGPPVYSVAGTPVDCVRVALGGGIVADATLVISAINHGANVGDDTLNSGTYGAAVEAALFDVPAIAISQQSLPGHAASSTRPECRPSASTALPPTGLPSRVPCSTIRHRPAP